MTTLYLITGGGRSGKSAHAESIAEGLPGPRTYVATCPVFDNDEEMIRRVDRHQQDRSGKGWTTIEETLDLVQAFNQAAPGGVVLVDCLTLWVNNLMYQSEQLGQEFGEDQMVMETEEMLAAARNYVGTVIFVSNEVGQGIIPANAMARIFRDCAGRCNQKVAATADKVTHMVCGLPLELK